MTRRYERVYALARCADERWLLLNRRYKPFGIGASPRSWFNYEECDGTRVWLRERDLKALDGGALPYRTGDQMLWLFHDATAPDRNVWQLRKYLQRLAVLGLDEAEAVA